jgi:hypothetical protein
MVAEHVARADDHVLVLMNQSGPAALVRSFDDEDGFEVHEPGHVVEVGRGRHHRIVDFGELLLGAAALDADDVVQLLTLDYCIVASAAWMRWPWLSVIRLDSTFPNCGCLAPEWMYCQR